MLSQTELKTVLRYVPEQGHFIWLDYPLPSGKARRRTGKTAIGSIAGSYNKLGYLEIRYNGKLYLGHRLAWLYVYGVTPTEIDHINRNPSDNRIINLRVATRTQQMANIKRMSTNKSGFKGVCAHGKRFSAYIKINEKTKYLGMFDTPEEAHAKYIEAASSQFGEFARAS